MKRLAMPREIVYINVGGFEPSPQRYTTARFVIDSANGRQPLPDVTDTLPLAEAFRRELLGICRRVLARGSREATLEEVCRHCPALTGKDAVGRPLRGHRHAFFVPTDEDGDGRIDHVTVVAEQGFTPSEVRSLDRLREVRQDDSDPLRLLLVGLGSERDPRVPLFVKSASWISATPFVATRYPKRRGAKRDQPEHYATPREFARHDLLHELERVRERRLGLPELVHVESLDTLGRSLRPIQFCRDRQKSGDDGGRRPTAAFRLVFAAPLQGPLCLGHSCHFGLGLFLPE
jgi:CRISPR-associated protein Csb2